MNTFINPKGVPEPLGAYTQAIHVPANAEWLLISGQVGVDAKGKLRVGIDKQAEQVFRNILAALKGAGMDKQDLVKFTVYLTDARHVANYRAAREKIIGNDALPTSTLLIVEGLASPDMCIEIEAWAAKAS